MKKSIAIFPLAVQFWICLMACAFSQDSSSLYQIDRDDWKTGAGIWSKDDDGYFQKSKTDLTVLGLFHHNIKNVVIEFDFKFEDFTHSGSWAGVSFRKSTVLNPYGDGGYIVYFRPNGILELFCGNQTLKAVPSGLDVTEKVHVKIEVIDKSLNVFLNNSPKPQLTAEIPIIHKGYLDLETAGASAHFDSFSISNPDQ